LGGLAAGFLGAGLFGMLFGNGFLSGMGSFAGVLGLLLQIALVVIVARLAWNWWQRRNQPASAMGPAMRQSLDGGGPDAAPARGAPGATGLGGLFAGLTGGRGAPAGTPIQISPEDFDTFE